MNEAEKYHYEFPEELIAQAPASPRDSAKLLVYDRRKKRTQWTVFSEIAAHLPPRALLVLNETKVIPARLELRKPTGGRVRILYLGAGTKTFRALADRGVKPGDVLSHNSGKRFEVMSREKGEYELKPLFPMKELPRLLDRFGETPIPPYIKNSPLDEKHLRREYQTVFAKKIGSVAAPTASLHFTPALLKKLEKQGIDSARVTLHVGLGTFAPLTEEHLRSGKLHFEEFDISTAAAAKINRAKKAGRPIVAVGTTVVRTLESAGRTGVVRPGKGRTDLFIREGHRLRIADGIITNFHVPRSSLLMLVSAFIGRRVLLRLYREAIKRRFRLFSFGDAMLIR